MAEGILEKDFQRTVIEMAKVLGWRVHAERPAIRQSGKWSTPIQGDAGFPDLVLAHPQKGVIFAELKSERGRLSEGQRDWYSALQGNKGKAPVGEHLANGAVEAHFDSIYPLE